MNTNANDLLKHHRRQIDRIDHAMIDLLAERFQVVDEIGKIKHAHNIDVVLPERMEQVIRQCVQRGTRKNVDPALVRTIWTAIIDTAIAEEQKLLHTESEM